MKFPVTSLAWKPNFDEDNDGPQFLLGSCCDGTVMRWNSFKADKVEHVTLDGESVYHSVAYSFSGRRFVVAGSNKEVQIYDDDRSKLVCSFSKDLEKRHSNVIFTSKFFPESDNLLYSGGWDRNVKFWDVRSNTMTHNLYGPMICS